MEPELRRQIVHKSGPAANDGYRRRRTDAARLGPISLSLSLSTSSWTMKPYLGYRLPCRWLRRVDSFTARAHAGGFLGGADRGRNGKCRVEIWRRNNRAGKRPGEKLFACSWVFFSPALPVGRSIQETTRGACNQPIRHTNRIVSHRTRSTINKQ